MDRYDFELEENGLPYKYKSSMHGNPTDGGLEYILTIDDPSDLGTIILAPFQVEILIHNLQVWLNKIGS